MTKIYEIFSVGLIVAFIAAGFLFFISKESKDAVLVYAGAATSTPTNTTGTVRMYEFLTATTTSATSTNTTDGSGAFNIAGAKKVVFYFSRGGATSANIGSSKFEIEVSPDGSSWYDFPRLFLADTSQTASSTIGIGASTSTTIASLDLEDQGFYAVRCQVVETTDGEHSCRAYAEF